MAITKPSRFLTDMIGTILNYEKEEQNRREKRITGDNQWRNEN